jgi:DNA-binding NtrC family response regulator
MMSTKIYGELGSTADVEISAVGDKNADPDYIGMLIRDVTARSRSASDDLSFSEPDREDDASLEHLIKVSTEAIERQRITAALEKSAGNRTMAAKLLGLSRQSLHTKLNKYYTREN